MPQNEAQRRKTQLASLDEFAGGVAQAVADGLRRSFFEAMEEEMISYFKPALRRTPQLDLEAMKLLEGGREYADEGLTDLHRIGRARVGLDREESEHVRMAREAGRSWQDIADALGRSKQGVWEKYHKE